MLQRDVAWEDKEILRYVLVFVVGGPTPVLCLNVPLSLSDKWQDMKEQLHTIVEMLKRGLLLLHCCPLSKESIQ